MTIEEIEKNKQVTKADIKFLKEFVYEQGNEKTFENPLTGARVSCTGYLAGLIKFIFDIEPWLSNTERLQMYHDKLTKKNAISKFDRARYLVMKLDYETYMKLID